MRTLRELQLLRNIRHENVIALKDVMMPIYTNSFKDVYLVYELMDTDLHQIIKSPQPLSSDHCKYFLFQLASNGLSATQLDVWLVSRNLGKGVKDDDEISDVHDFLMGTINNVPVEERTSEFKTKLYEEVVQNNKRGKVTCVGKTIQKMWHCSSSSRVRRTIQESEELREQVLSLKEEKEEFKQIKEDMKQEREEFRLKMAALDDLIATYGPPQPSPRIGSCSANGAPQVPDVYSTGRQVQLASSPSIRKDGRKVEFLGDGIPKQVVAEGTVVSEDPQEKVANLPLGPNHWKIFLENAICPTYILSGSVEDGDAFTVGQAINTILAWPKVNVLEK